LENGMVKRTVELHPSFKLFTTTVNGRQLYCTATFTDPSGDPALSAARLYGRVSEILSESSMQIVHERLFGDLAARETVMKARTHAETDADWPVTYIQGLSCSGAPFTGVQIRAVRPLAEGDRVWTAYDGGRPVGRAWNRNGASFIIMQDCHGLNGGSAGAPPDRMSQTDRMFRRAERILKDEGFSYPDVVRTWIYIADILDWYGDFNKARNVCYTDFGFLGGPRKGGNSAEKLYLPASTGIEGRNPAGAAATMDVFAVRRAEDSPVRIRHITGTQQKSPFRYGSAFSRAVVVDEEEGKLILVSGTASIDEAGQSTHLGDVRAQIEQTLEVISSLIAPEGATLADLCEATVFLKRKDYLPVWLSIAENRGLTSVPSVNVVADVCREELLFELDAAFVVGKAG
jgi:enamine deaminase RidA (YjgF/YER057c/UK114 family)